MCSSPVLFGAEAYFSALHGAIGNPVDANAPIRGADLCVASYRSPAYDLSVAAMRIPRLSINLTSVPATGGIAGEPARRYAGRRYSLFFTPAHADARWRKPAASRHVNIYFQPRILERARGTSCSALLSQPMLDVQMRSVRPLVDALESALARDDTLARDAVASLALLIVDELLGQPRAAPSRLSSSALARVQDFVAASLDSPIRVADLATAAGMPLTRFAPAFTAATGTSPHRFVLVQRVQRAEHLLRSSRLELAEIALMCGFSSQQHLTTTMARMTGRTPGELRRGQETMARPPSPTVASPNAARQLTA